jgi:ribosomal protein S12 methylthiotransferase accessory factor
MSKIMPIDFPRLMRLHQAREAEKRSPSGMELNIRFPGGLEVEADMDGHTVLTDQPEAVGGAGAAPSPFDLFLASIGTCAGYYALRFCQARGLATDDVTLKLTAEKDPAVKRVRHVAIEIELPPDFPPRYREAIVRATDQCSVKKHLLDPPEIEVTARTFAEPPAAVGVGSSLPA